MAKWSGVLGSIVAVGLATGALVKNAFEGAGAPAQHEKLLAKNTPANKEYDKWIGVLEKLVNEKKDKCPIAALKIHKEPGAKRLIVIITDLHTHPFEKLGPEEEAVIMDSQKELTDLLLFLQQSDIKLDAVHWEGITEKNRKEMEDEVTFHGDSIPKVTRMKNSYVEMMERATPERKADMEKEVLQLDTILARPKMDARYPVTQAGVKLLPAEDHTAHSVALEATRQNEDRKVLNQLYGVREQKTVDILVQACDSNPGHPLAVAVKGAGHKNNYHEKFPPGTSYIIIDRSAVRQGTAKLNEIYKNK